MTVFLFPMKPYSLCLEEVLAQEKERFLFTRDYICGVAFEEHVCMH